MAIRSLLISLLLLLAALGSAHAQAVGTCPNGIATSFAGCLPPIVTPLQRTDGISVFQGGRLNAIWGTAGINQLLNPADYVVASGRVVTVSGAITALISDQIIAVNKTVGAPTTVNAPSCLANTSLKLTVVDAKGDANVNNITIVPSAGLINGAQSYVLNIGFGDVTVWFTGSACVVIP